ncbi:MAG: ABC transporter ATP-binding protein [Planctomycetota bacterium]
MIEIDHLTKTFDNRPAVDDLSLAVARGEIVAFLGPNGAGKTTTIKVMTGLLLPSAGTVRIGGYDITRDPVAAKKVLAYVPDQPWLYDKLTGREFLEFIGRLYGLTPAERRHRIDEYAAYFEAGDYLDHLIESYSHGMKQKVVLSAAFLHDPRVLVLDEPMVGLDPKSMKLLKALLRRKAGEGLSIFMSTHTLPVAEEVADRVGIIHRGRLTALGTVPEILALAKEKKGLEDVFLEITGETTGGNFRF